MSTEQLQIIFVDDEQRILDGLRRQLHAHRAQWNMRFALSGCEALQMLDALPADIVVSDMRMPGMPGGQLLQRIRQIHPQVTRIVLSGQTDQAELMRDLGCIHQYLQKPCEPGQLCNAIERAFRLSGQLHQPQLRAAVNQIQALPPQSETYRAMMDAMSREGASVCEVADIVARDPALSVKVMQLVNSAFFGMPRKINSPRDAVVLLGLKTLRAIVVAGRVFEHVSSGSTRAGELTTIWNHSVAVGEAAGKLAALDGASQSAQQHARLSGLLSLIGSAILLTTAPEEYAKMLDAAKKSGRSVTACELEAFGATQSDVTAYAMGLWAFSDDLVAAATYQTNPSHMPGYVAKHPIGYLHAARFVAGPIPGGLQDPPLLDEAFLTQHKFGPLIERQTRSAA